MITVKHLNKYFNRGKQNEIHVIDNVTLALPDTGMVAIFGKSGCGKTTLLNVIGGLDKFASGSVELDGNDIRKDTDTLRNKYVGYIFQNYNLDNSKSCFDNVADALRLCGIKDTALIEDRVTKALFSVGMEKYRGRTPDTLSGGQQQRIAIARAIVKNPRIILADEPTGNLDEANTIKIMNLLKAFSKDHLVLLVTHESDLVDYYCDMVIGLADGRVLGVRQNTEANGYRAKDKNALYLGEFEKNVISDSHAEIEYYGDAPESPLKITVVNDKGRIYLKLDDERVRVLDSSSEIKLLQGVFEAKNVTTEEAHLDIEDLPTFEGQKYGRLYNLRQSVKSGYKYNFKQFKKGKKLLRNCLGLFSAVLVLMMSLFGTSVSKLIDVNNSYNHNVFYVNTQSEDTSKAILEAIGNGEGGMDSAYLMSDYPSGDHKISFRTGYFETFTSDFFDTGFETNAVLLDISLAKDQKLAVGKKDGLDGEEILITTRVADELIKKSNLGYIEKYRDLLGLISTFSVNGRNLRIAGIVESDESSVYLNTLTLARYSLSSGQLRLVIDSDIGMDVNQGETVIIDRYSDGSVKLPGQGKEVLVRGNKLTVSKVLKSNVLYDQWLKNRGISKIEFDKYVLQNSDKFASIDEAYDSLYYEWVADYLSEIDAYAEEMCLLAPDNIDYWLAAKKNVKLVKYSMAGYTDLYLAEQYKAQNGRYPKQSEISNDYSRLDEELKNVYLTYENEFYSSNFGDVLMMYDYTYIVDEADYIKASVYYGETDESVYSYYYEEDIYYEDGIYYEDDVYFVDTSNLCYTVIHSNDPKATELWIAENFADLEDPTPYMSALVTPKTIKKMMMAQNLAEILANVISMIVILAIMIVCMYFIMRSSLLNRIKEVGISRAIGVSKKNLSFKFFVESLVLTALTSFIGFIVTSIFIKACMMLSPMMTTVFFYPWWYALILLVVITAVSSICGMIPILGLLRKTPSEILAKYDI